jgi:hypothetical protein
MLVFCSVPPRLSISVMSRHPWYPDGGAQRQVIVALRHIGMVAFFVQQVSPALQFMHVAQFAAVQKDP